MIPQWIYMNSSNLLEISLRNDLLQWLIHAKTIGQDCTSIECAKSMSTNNQANQDLKI